MNLAALWKVSYGMYVVCARSGDRKNGQIANTVFQITAEPPTVAVSICKQNLTHQIIEEGRVFSVSVLSQSAPMELIGRFGFKSGRDLDKLDGVPQKIGRTGAPIVVAHAIACLEAEVVTSVDAGTHTIFVGRIVDAEILGDEPAMTYDYFHVVKRGTAPKTAPTYQAPEAPAPSASTERHRCTVCGYVYDPAAGDPDHGVPPGTRFEDLPADWVCPICGAAASDFERDE